MSKTSIFIRSWRQDRFFLDYLLRSLEKFATGFLETVVAIPECDRPHFEGASFHGAKVMWTDWPDSGRGYAEQQVDKINADLYCSGDLIVNLDSDCFVLRKFTPQSFMENDRPIALIRHWADAGTAQQWKPSVEKVLGFTPVFETMCCMPIIWDRRMLPLFRDYFHGVQGVTPREYVTKMEGTEFSEFNVVMNFAMRYCPYMYSWRIACPGVDGFPRDVIVQRWSWSEKGVGEFEETYEQILTA